MQASVRQRSDKGVEFLASYTLGKTRTNNRGFYGVFGGTGLQGVTSATEGAYWQNTYDPDAEWGPAFHDVRHNFIFSATYELPFGSGRTWGARMVGPWSTRCSGDGGLAASSRRAADCRSPSSTGVNRSQQGERGAERPNCVGNPVPSDQSITHWLDVTAFERAALGTFGNCPVGVARAPGYANVDLVLSKRFDIHSSQVRRVPRRGLQRPQSPEFRPSGA